MTSYETRHEIIRAVFQEAHYYSEILGILVLLYLD